MPDPFKRVQRCKPSGRPGPHRAEPIHPNNNPAESLTFGSDDDAQGLQIASDSLQKLEADYVSFVYSIPAWIFDSIDDLCFVSGDVHEQLAHHYVMTRMGHGVGFWEKSDWEEKAGAELTKLCRQQGYLESYVGDDNLLHIF